MADLFYSVHFCCVFLDLLTFVVCSWFATQISPACMLDFILLEHEEQQPPAIPPPPSSASLFSSADSPLLSASSSSPYSPGEVSRSTLKRQPAQFSDARNQSAPYQERSHLTRDTSSEGLPSRSIKENLRATSYGKASQEKTESAPQVPPPPGPQVPPPPGPRFAVLNFSAASQRNYDSKHSDGPNRSTRPTFEKQPSLYNSSPALFETGQGDRQTSPTAPSGNTRGLIGSYEQLYGGKNQPQYTGNQNQHRTSPNQQGNFHQLYGNDPNLAHRPQKHVTDSPASYRNSSARFPDSSSESYPGPAPAPPIRQSSIGDGRVLSSWRDGGRAPATQQPGVKSSPQGLAAFPKGIPV